MIAVRTIKLILAVTLGISAGVTVYAADADFPAAEQLRRQGHYADALTLYRKLLTGREANPHLLGAELSGAVFCLNRLNRIAEFDALADEAVKRHSANPGLLQATAREYMGIVHLGQLIDNRFRRGYSAHDTGPVRLSFARDRVTALQLYLRAMPLVEQTYTARDKAAFYWEFAQALRRTDEANSAWKLQVATDVSRLPAYERQSTRLYLHDQHPAPVDPNGEPVFYHLPGSWDQAANDGERWRWLLARVAANGDAVNSAMAWADFLRSQYGVQTLIGRNLPAHKSREALKEILSRLKDDETVALLASGIRRFKLPADCNFVQIYRQLAPRKNAAAATLADIYLNRCQYVNAEATLKQFPEGDQHGLEFQLTSNLARFEPLSTQMDSGKPTVTFCYRNADSINFTATRIKVDLLLQDIRAYLSGNPDYLDWAQIDPARIGQQLLNQSKAKYLDQQIAVWTVKLAPPPGHNDAVKTIELPFCEFGAYLLRAELPGGYSCATVLWLTNTVVVRKSIGQKVLYYLADATTGVPVKDARLNFFGYRQKPVDHPIRAPSGKTRRFNIATTTYDGITNGDGIFYADASKLPEDHNWLMEASVQNRCVAFMGFSRLWYSSERQREYDAVKMYCVTDRPVYRPGDTVQFKAWGARVSYDSGPPNPFAGVTVRMDVIGPMGKSIASNTYIGDASGGFNGRVAIPGEARLGLYRIALANGQGHCTFRVEEFRKPEFEVSVSAPSSVLLGKPFDFAVDARYYFGRPVSGGVVEYRLTRTPLNQERYPPAPWDWLYGSGYWWNRSNEQYAARRLWLPWPGNLQETVASGAAPLRRDGTFSLKVDTSEAAKLLGENDFYYEMSVEVTDSSRRTVRGRGKVLVAAVPFRTWLWTGRNYYRSGDTVRVWAAAIAPSGQPLKATGELKVLSIASTADGKRLETPVGSYPITTDTEERTMVKFKLDQPGQYRLTCRLKDEKENEVAGDYELQVVGSTPSSSVPPIAADGLEIIPDKREYRPGETVKLLINTSRPNNTLLLFTRPDDVPEVIRIKGHSLVKEIKVSPQDMPDFHVQGITVADGKILTDTRRIVVPPEKKILQLTVQPSALRAGPRQKIKVRLKLTDLNSLPVSGTIAVTVYDKALDYFAPSDYPDIRSFFWKWLRHYDNNFDSNLLHSYNLLPPGSVPMRELGCFGQNFAPPGARARNIFPKAALALNGGGQAETMAAAAATPESDHESGAVVDIPLRTDFADTAYWAAVLTADAEGNAEFELPLPDNLTTWKIRAWAMTDKVMVGQGDAEVICSKNFMVRLVAPRFLVQGDRPVVSAIIHNYQHDMLDGKIDLTVPDGLLQLDGTPAAKTTCSFNVPSGRQQIVSWPLVAVEPGDAKLTVKAAAGESSDGVPASLPILLRGSETGMYVCGSISSSDKANSAQIKFAVPTARRKENSRIVVNYSPTVAGAVIEALPYLFSYKYECTEQTLNRFLPAVVAHKTLSDLGINLAAAAEKKNTLSPDRSTPTPEAKEATALKLPPPLYSDREADRLVNDGLKRLASLQLNDGGWGWFSGSGERSSPHITAQIVRGLLIASQSGIYVNSDMQQRGIEWLKNYQNRQIELLKNAGDKKAPHAKLRADNLDALVFMVLCASGNKDVTMKEYLYRDRTELSVYGQILLALALAEIGNKEEAATALKDVAQFVEIDKENGTAWVKPDGGPWWLWYGNKIEATACYLKLLSKFGTSTDLATASMLARYLTINRRHANFWESTRDTALCVESLCEYLRRSGELNSSLKIKVMWDGKLRKEIVVNRDNLFSFDNSFRLENQEITDGAHVLELIREGSGPLYYSAALTYFSEEKKLPASGKDLRVTRNFYLIHPETGTQLNVDRAGKPLKTATVTERREKIDPATHEIAIGSILEIELVIQSSNDYEYVVIEDFRAAGLEPIESRSGYIGSPLNAYGEYRSDRSCFFLSRLPQGHHRLPYRVKTEVSGTFTALPTLAYGMYAPELKGNAVGEEFHLGERISSPDKNIGPVRP